MNSLKIDPVAALRECCGDPECEDRNTARMFADCACVTPLIRGALTELEELRKWKEWAEPQITDLNRGLPVVETPTLHGRDIGTDPGIPVHATLRDSSSDDGYPTIDIECRYADGQKYASVSIDGECQQLAALLLKAITTVETRPCTCHPDDRPPFCQQKYAASECQQAFLTHQKSVT